MSKEKSPENQGLKLRENIKKEGGSALPLITTLFLQN